MRRHNWRSQLSPQLTHPAGRSSPSHTPTKDEPMRGTQLPTRTRRWNSISSYAQDCGTHRLSGAHGRFNKQTICWLTKQASTNVQGMKSDKVCALITGELN